MNDLLVSLVSFGDELSKLIYNNQTTVIITSVKLPKLMYNNQTTVIITSVKFQLETLFIYDLLKTSLLISHYLLFNLIAGKHSCRMDGVIMLHKTLIIKKKIQKDKLADLLQAGI